jgi:hypothetical protein
VILRSVVMRLVPRVWSPPVRVVGPGWLGIW